MSIEELIKGKPTKLFTLIVVLNENKTLLGYKKRGFAYGKWNGFGGKVEPGESIINAAKRELEEECGLVAKSLTKLGVLYFENDSWEITLHEVHLFLTTDYEGEIIESDEMIPRWFAVEELPFDGMLAPNEHWLPRALKGQSFDALFLLQGKEDKLKLLNAQIEEH